MVQAGEIVDVIVINSVNYANKFIIKRRGAADKFSTIPAAFKFKPMNLLQIQSDAVRAKCWNRLIRNIIAHGLAEPHISKKDSGNGFTFMQSESIRAAY